jgi:transposase
MFLRTTKRTKNGKSHRYFSVVESRRLPNGEVIQQTVIYLGEINDAQETAWRKTLLVFDDDRKIVRTLSLFPEERSVPHDAVNAVQVKLNAMELRRPRSFGDCWLGCVLWNKLKLSEFWTERFGDTRGEVAWDKVLELLVINRLIDPGSEFRLHRQWFDRTAMDELLGVTFAAAGKDRLYRCLDKILPHKNEMFLHLRKRWGDLFSAEFDVLLYDLTSTYFEGLSKKILKARYGYSRDGRPDCRQVVIALVITTDGLPLAYEVMPGNTSDKTTLRDFLKLIESRYGKARRVWLMDRGIPTEEILKEMREEGCQYLVGTPKGKLTDLEKDFISLPWQKVREGVSVKLLEQSGEVLVLAKSEGRREKEKSMRRRKLKNLFKGLRELRKRAPIRDKLLERLGVLKSEAGRAAGLVEIVIPKSGEKVTEDNFRWRLRTDKYKAAERRDGHYLLRTNLTGEDPALLWTRYMQLVEIESAFKCLKSDLAIRPIYHQTGSRVEAHIFIAFIAYCLVVTLRKMLEPIASGLTPKAVLEKLSEIKMIDVWLPTTDGRWLVMPRHTEPEEEQKILLKFLGLALPAQPLPRIHLRLSQETIRAKK